MKIPLALLAFVNADRIDLQYAQQSSTFESRGSDCGPAFASNPLQNKQDTSKNGNWINNGSCACAATSKEKNAYWRAELLGYSKVKKVRILERNTMWKGQDNSLEVLIDGQLCGTTPEDPDLGEWTTVECPDGGLKGSKITLSRKKKGYLAFCGIEVYGESGYETITPSDPDPETDPSDPSDPGEEPGFNDAEDQCQMKIQELE